jgi:hypothetical protein
MYEEYFKWLLNDLIKLKYRDAMAVLIILDASYEQQIEFETEHDKYHERRRIIN